MVSMTFKGTTELALAFATLPQAVRGPVRLEALRTAGEPIRQRMASLAPHGPDAPHLSESMTMSPAKTIDGVAIMPETESAIAIGPSKDFYYGLFLEFGWVFRPAAHPFVRPAYDESKDAAIEAIGRLLWAAIESRPAGGA